MEFTTITRNPGKSPEAWSTQTEMRDRVVVPAAAWTWFFLKQYSVRTHFMSASRAPKWIRAACHFTQHEEPSLNRGSLCVLTIVSGNAFVRRDGRHVWQHWCRSLLRNNVMNLFHREFVRRSSPGAKGSEPNGDESNLLPFIEIRCVLDLSNNLR